MSDEHDFTVEPIRGLPEALPPGEEILWQGRPSAFALARDSLSLYWVAGYFALLVLWRFWASTSLMPAGEAALTAVPLAILGLLASMILYGIAWAQARASVYTITTERVALRIGAALTLTLNLPFPKILAADLTTKSDGTGTIALTTVEGVKLSYLILWPHVRPWQMKRTQPALRSIKDADRVAGILAEAAQTRIAQPEIARAPHGAVAAE